MKILSGLYKLELAQLVELQSFSQFAAELGIETMYRLARGYILLEMLKQCNGSPISLVFYPYATKILLEQSTLIMYKHCYNHTIQYHSGLSL